jgi:molecular chaperone GrpE
MEKKDIPVEGPEKEQKQAAEEQTNIIDETESLENENFEEESAESNDEADAENNEKQNAVDENSKAAAELSEMKDKYLRLYAEFDNYRKRTLREREELIKTAAEGAIKSIIPTLDDFERAIKAAKAANEENSIVEGIVLIYEKMLRTLEQQGLKAMESDTQPFDPDLHEALTKVPVPSDDMKGKVIETIEKGYYLKEKIIRYAKVVVGQ